MNAIRGCNQRTQWMQPAHVTDTNHRQLGDSYAPNLYFRIRHLLYLRRTSSCSASNALSSCCCCTLCNTNQQGYIAIYWTHRVTCPVRIESIAVFSSSGERVSCWSCLARAFSRASVTSAILESNRSFTWNHSAVSTLWPRMKGLLGMRMKFCKGRRRRVFSLTNIIQIYDERITVFNPTKTAVSNSSTTLCQTAWGTKWESSKTLSPRQQQAAAQNAQPRQASTANLWSSRQ